MNIQYYVGSFVHGRGWPIYSSFGRCMGWYETEVDAEFAVRCMRGVPTYAQVLDNTCRTFNDFCAANPVKICRVNGGEA